MPDQPKAEELEALFHRALDLPLEEREEFLKRSCPDEEMRAVLRALLQGDAAETRSVLQRGAAPGERPRLQRIGRYTLLEVLGEGGMGTVHLAWQEEPVRRKVALKTIRLGMHTETVMARFETERQVLAIMDHPGIAKIYDGGVADSGLPYFVMEYVPGLPLTVYCDMFRLDVDSRLRLFGRICDAVQHAHQKGIAHRDLKPGNVLVIEQDGEPLPKVIDFGIARAVSGPLTDDRRTLTVGQTIGTFSYMSPEQADPRGHDVDTRTDVYSLGVMLYELLSGERPFELDDSAESAQQSWVDWMRKLMEEEPPRPSTRVTRAGSAAEGTARSMRLNVRALAKRLGGDLDWIVMRAMEKDRTRRYASVSELRADLERHAAHEPVNAGPPSTAYRARKFVQRHKLAVIAAVLVVLSLLGGVVGTGLGLRRALTAESEANRQLAEARYQAQKAGAFIEYLDYSLSEGLPSAREGEELTVLDLFEPPSGAIEDLFENRPAAQAAARFFLGRAYLLLGEDERARVELLAAYRIQKAELSGDHPDRLSTLQLLVHVSRRLGRLEAAEGYARESVELARSILVEAHPDLESELNVLLGVAAGGAADPEAALSGLSTILAQYPDVFSGEGSALGRLVIEAGRRVPEGALFFEKLREEARALGGIRRLMFLWILTNNYLQAEDADFEAAASCADELEQVAAELLPGEHWMRLDAERLRALALAGSSPEDFARAEALMLEVYERIERMPGRKSTRMLETQKGLAQLCRIPRSGSWIEGSWRRWRESSSGKEKANRWWVVTRPGIPVATVEAALQLLDAEDGGAVVESHRGFALCRLGRFGEALAALDAGVRPGPGEDPIELAFSALCLEGLGRGESSRDAFERLRGLIASDLDSLPSQARSLLAEVETELGVHEAHEPVGR